MELENIGGEISIDYLQNIIDKEKHDEIIVFFNKWCIENSGIFKNHEQTNGRNIIVRFGSTQPYSSYHFGNTIPDIFLNILPKNIVFTSVTINEYLPGQSIDYHVDAGASDKIYILSLCSSSTIQFRNRANKDEIIEFELEPMSLATIEGELRWKYEHSLQANEYRLSIVFR